MTSELMRTVLAIIAANLDNTGGVWNAAIDAVVTGRAFASQLWDADWARAVDALLAVLDRTGRVR